MIREAFVHGLSTPKVDDLVASTDVLVPGRSLFLIRTSSGAAHWQIADSRSARIVSVSGYRVPAEVLGSTEVAHGASERNS